MQEGGVEAADGDSTSNNHNNSNKDIRKACNNCIKAKAACDSTRPCNRCISHKIADSCVSVARKTKRKAFLESLSPYPHTSSLSSSSCPCQSSIPTSIPCMLNSSLNNIINNLNNSPTTYLAQHAHSGNIMASNIINTAVQNLYSSNTSAIISNTISSLGDTVETQIDYESALNWLQNAISVPTYATPSSPSIIYPPQSSSNINTNKNTTSHNNINIKSESNNTITNNDNISSTFRTPIISSLPSPSQPDLVPSSTESNVSSPSSSESSASTPASQPNTPSPATPSLKTPPSPTIPTRTSITLPEVLHQDLPPLPTLNITIYTKTDNNDNNNASPPSGHHPTYISALLKFSPQGHTQDHAALSSSVHPHNISIPNCSAESLVQTISLLSKYSAIDLQSPVHIDYTYASVPFALHPVGLVETTAPIMVDCNEPFAKFCGYATVDDAIRQARPVNEFLLPQGWAWAKRSVELLIKHGMPFLERYHVFLLRDRPPRVFLTQHKLVGTHHRTITFLEEYPDFPLCFFADWIKKILPNAILPPCSRPYCHCKYPDE